MKQRRVSKHEWLEKGLELLEGEGIAAVRIDRLARELKTSRSGFYWHFKDRAELCEAMLDYWAHEFTEIITNNPELAKGPPKERLRKMMEMIFDLDLTRFDVSMRAWADADAAVAKQVRRVYDIRYQFIRDIFAELGFSGTELEMRARLCVCYHSWELPMFTQVSKKSLRELIPRRLALLTRK